MRASLRQLEYVISVAETLHFGRAAALCEVSQPALSVQIAQLEEVLGVRIFERSRRRVLVTPLGERLVAQARRVLREVSELADLARAGEGPFARALRLGVSPTLAAHLLPPLLAAVREARPELEILLHEGPVAPSLRSLDEGGIDALLAMFPVEGPLDSMTLLREPLVVVAAASHPLMALRRKRLRMSDLRAHEVLLLDPEHALHDRVREICELAGAHEVRRIRASSIATLAQMVANGIGVSVLPESSALAEQRTAPDLAVRPFAAPVPKCCVGLVWRRGSARASECRLLGELFRAQLAR